MTAHEWIDLIAKEFNCSRALAKEMYHGMVSYYKVKGGIKKIGNVKEAR